MINTFVLNKILHDVSLSRMISSNKQMKYDTKENDIPDWLNKGPRYRTAIFYKLHVTVFNGFIRNDRTKICNIMCSITADDKLQPTDIDDAISVGGR